MTITDKKPILLAGILMLFLPLGCHTQKKKELFIIFQKVMVTAQKSNRIDPIQNFFSISKQKSNMKPMQLSLATYKKLAVIPWNFRMQSIGYHTAYLVVESSKNTYSQRVSPPEPLLLKVTFKKEDSQWKWEDDFLPPGVGNNPLMMDLELLKEKYSVKSTWVNEWYPKSPAKVVTAFLEKLSSAVDPEDLFLYCAPERRIRIHKDSKSAGEWNKHLLSSNLIPIQERIGYTTAYVVTRGKYNRETKIEFILKKVDDRWKIFEELDRNSKLKT